MKKLGEKKIIEMTSSKSLEFFAQITNLTLERRRSKEQVKNKYNTYLVKLIFKKFSISFVKTSFKSW